MILPAGDTDNPLMLLRISRGWTQEDLAQRSGVSRTQITRIETGRIRRLKKGTALKFAQAFDLEEKEWWQVRSDLWYFAQQVLGPYQPRRKKLKTNLRSFKGGKEHG